MAHAMRSVAAAGRHGADPPPSLQGQQFKLGNDIIGISRNTSMINWLTCTHRPCSCRLRILAAAAAAACAASAFRPGAHSGFLFVTSP